MKLNVLKFALSGGILLSIMVILSTFFSIVNIPGFVYFTNLLSQFYGFYGYSVSWIGIIVGGFWGFVEGLIWFGIFAWIYNKLIK